jgi:hypothetical protein
VLNLAADKPAVFREMARVLKPGGRVAVSDIALKKELPPELAASVAAYVGCVAGALPVAEYERLLKDAGFAAVEVVDAGADLNAYAKVENQSGCCSPAVGEEEWIAASQSCCGAEPPADVHAGLADLLTRYDVNEYAASVKVFAVKPG